jgi:hypothetical protein
MKYIYKVGIRYFSDLDKAEKYLKKFYVRSRPGIIEKISVDCEDLDKNIQYMMFWVTDSEGSLIRTNISRQYCEIDDLPIGIIRVSPPNFGDLITCAGIFEFRTAKEAYKKLRNEYTEFYLNYFKENIMPKLPLTNTLYIKI